jgi:hypothetical protein
MPKPRKRPLWRNVMKGDVYVLSDATKINLGDAIFKGIEDNPFLYEHL